MYFMYVSFTRRFVCKCIDDSGISENMFGSLAHRCIWTVSYMSASCRNLQTFKEHDELKIPDNVYCRSFYTRRTRLLYCNSTLITFLSDTHDVINPSLVPISISIGKTWQGLDVDRMRASIFTIIIEGAKATKICLSYTSSNLLRLRNHNRCIIA